jgi:SPOR domain
MKKLLLNITLILCSGLFIQVHSQIMDNKGGTLAVHEARFMVRNYTTKEPISQAGIFDKTGKQLGTTDANGTVVLNLPSSSADLYTIKAPGFNPMSIRLTYAAKTSSDYDVYLPVAEEGNLIADENPPALDKNTEPDLVKVYVKQDPNEYKKGKNDEGHGVEFAVQLSATSRPITDKSTLKSWEELGPVYIHTENGLYKVRIGPYHTQEGAAQILLQAKARGKKDAFIVVQKGIENHVPFEFEDLQDKKMQTEVVAAPTVATPVVTNDSEVAGEYKVRLASYLKPGGFNTTDIDQYGTLESYRQGEWTIMLIGGFKTAKDAERVRDLVIAKGYTDAKVVVDRGGILETEY